MSDKFRVLRLKVSQLTTHNSQRFLLLLLLLLITLNSQLSTLNSVNAASSKNASERAAALFQQGTNKYMAGDIPAAVKDLEKVIALDPQHEQARTLLSIVLGETASSYFIQGDFARALPLLEKLSKIFPDDPEIKRMYDQASKGVATHQRSEDMVKFLQKQQRSILSQETKQSRPLAQKPPRTAERETKLPQTLTTTVQSSTSAVQALDEEVNRRVLALKNELKKREEETMAQTRMQLAKEKRELLRKVFLWCGGFTAAVSLLLALFALFLRRHAQKERQHLTDGIEKIVRHFRSSEIVPSPSLKHVSAPASPASVSPPAKQPLPLEKKAAIPTPPLPVDPFAATELLSSKEWFEADELYAKACREVELIFERIQNWDISFGQNAVETVDALISNLQKNSAPLLKKAMDPYAEMQKHFFAHCVNVSILACYLKLREPPTRVREIGLAGILHDVGVAEKLDLMNEKRALRESEREILKLHRKSGAWILKNLGMEKQAYGSFRQKISEIVQATHEMVVLLEFRDSPINISAKPKIENNLSPDPSIQEIAALIGFVEVFEALTHNRPYRDAYTPQEAIQILKKNAQKNPAMGSYLRLLSEKLNIPQPEPASKFAEA